MDNAFYIDVKRCTGCETCAVACMDQNDTDIFTEPAYRKVYRHEKDNFPEEKVMFVSYTCMHCEDSPCLMACPRGAITKEESGAVIVAQELCIGCHSCSIACPFGVPKFDNTGKMQKCHMCEDRVKNGLEPACVQACPTKALQFGSMNDLAEALAEKASNKLIYQIGSNLKL